MCVVKTLFLFSVPSGKVRDCTLAFMQDGVRYVLIMSSAGHIYYQPLVLEASAVNGPFYVTNTMEVTHSTLKDNVTASEQIGGGGVSIYYCQTLQTLFFSYVQGMTFMASMTEIKDNALTCITQIVLAKNKNNGTPQPLCQWNDVGGHPGLITAFLQQSNNPVIVMVKPEGLTVQEIKVGSKAKIIDMVAIRHSSSNNQDQRTTLILLCEDGSLKIYMAGVEATGFWLSPALHPLSNLLLMKPPRKKRPALPSKSHHRSSGALSFPVDFFEHCSPINDIEYGGQDVLQVYNVQQVKHRLQTAACYIANTKPTGFSLEVSNNDASQVIVGVRVMLGFVDINRVPSYIEIFGRNLAVNLTRSRWFDFPLTKEESLQADKKIIINFGPSFDPGGVNIVDSVHIYGKSKESFGWPDDQDEFSGPSTSTAGLPALANASSGHDGGDGINSTNSSGGQMPHGPLDILISVVLDILDGCFTVEASPNNLEEHKSMALETASQLLTVPTSTLVEANNKVLLSTLFSTKTAYHSHKDQVMLKHVTKQEQNMQVETFERMVLNARVIAVSRPSNLARFAESNYKTSIDFINQLSCWFWELLESCPINSVVGKILVKFS